MNQSDRWEWWNTEWRNASWENLDCSVMKQHVRAHFLFKCKASVRVSTTDGKKKKKKRHERRWLPVYQCVWMWEPCLCLCRQDKQTSRSTEAGAWPSRRPSFLCLNNTHTQHYSGTVPGNTQVKYTRRWRQFSTLFNCTKWFDWLAAVTEISFSVSTRTGSAIS